jgi:putative spermidine/putrescine transport system ATP-binding protein/spermidine/putrescine transport system ATP-binding protein
MSSRIALMSEGRILQLAAPGDLYRRPASVFAAGFVGDANLLACSVERHGGRPAVVHRGVPVPGLEPNGSRGEVRVMVRPEDLRATRLEAGDGGDGLTGDVVASTFHGFFWMHRVQSAGESLVVRETRDVPSLGVGDRVALSIDPGRAVLLQD